MAGAAKPKSPPWVKEALRNLLHHYRDAMKLEYVYEEYFAKEEIYNERYKDHIAEVTSKKYKSELGGGIIGSFESATSAIGEVKTDENGKHTAGSNWLATQTSWRKFGLLTGYNMQFQKTSVLDLHLIDPSGNRVSPAQYKKSILTWDVKWDKLYKVFDQLEAGEEQARKMTRTLSAH